MSTQSEAEIRRSAQAFDAKMAAENRADRRKANLQRIARAGGPDGAEAKRILAAESAAEAKKAKADELAALPKSIAEAKGDAKAYSRADMKRRAAAKEGVTASSVARESMAKILRARGVEPLR